jgi:hypothetical protein
MARNAKSQAIVSRVRQRRPVLVSSARRAAKRVSGRTRFDANFGRDLKLFYLERTLVTCNQSSLNGRVLALKPQRFTAFSTQSGCALRYDFLQPLGSPLPLSFSGLAKGEQSHLLGWRSAWIEPKTGVSFFSQFALCWRAAGAGMARFLKQRGSLYMKHERIIWNPAAREWVCARCGRASQETNVHAAHDQLDRYDCRQSRGVEGAAGIETTRIMRDPFRALSPGPTQRSSSRFSVKAADGIPLIQLDTFDDKESSLKAMSLAFELVGGTTADQAKQLVNAMNERIVGVMVTLK